MVWFNVIVLLLMSPTIKKIHDDYVKQRKAGVEKPVFNPIKLGIKKCGSVDGNQCRQDFRRRKIKSVLYQIGKEVRL